MTQADPGTSRNRLLALIRKANDLLVRVMATQESIETEVTTLQATDAQLQQVADMATGAIVLSAQDRAALHSLVDALTARMSAAEVALMQNQTADQQRDANIAALTARAVTDEGVIVQLQARATTADAAITTIQARLTTDETTLATLQAAETQDAAAIAALTSRVANAETLLAAIQAKTVIAHLVDVALPAIVLAGTADITVTWPTPFPSATYTLDAPQIPAFIGKATATPKAGTQTATSVVVTVKSTALAITAGSVLEVLAYRYG